jgi:acyl-CoA synthetase (NDP forming)
MGPAWYDSGAIKGIVQAVLEDENIDAIILCIMFASANRTSVRVLSDLLLQWKTNKPVICCMSAPPGVWDEGIEILEQSGIPNYPTPERAAQTLANLYRFKIINSNFKTQMSKECQI